MSPIPCSSSHVVEWSDSRHVLRVRTLAEFLATNIHRFYEEEPQEYVPLGFFDSDHAATQFVEARVGKMKP